MGYFAIIVGVLTIGVLHQLIIAVGLLFGLFFAQLSRVGKS